MSSAAVVPRHAKKRRSSTGRNLAIFLRDVLVILLVAVLGSFLVKTFLLKPFKIPSESMSATLQVDDYIGVSLLTPGPFELQRGDVVVFADPGGWLPAPEPRPDGIDRVIEDVLVFLGLAPDTSQNYLVKRIVGLPGDVVACCNDFGQLTVNGVPVAEPYVRLPDPSMPVSAQDFSVTVPEGMYWVLGDNRYASADSRSHADTPHGGFVPEGDIVGKATFIWWPSSRWQLIDDHRQSFAAVPAAP